MGSLLDAARLIAARQRASVATSVSGHEINELHERTHRRKAVPAAEPERQDSASATDWAAYYQGRLTAWLGMGRKPEDATRWAWRQTADQWFRRHGTKSPEWACAGCGEELTGKDIHLLPFGQRAHGSNECVVAYGRRWQREARTALEGVGVPAPPLDEDGLA